MPASRCWQTGGPSIAAAAQHNRMHFSNMAMLDIVAMLSPCSTDDVLLSKRSGYESAADLAALLAPMGGKSS